MAAPSNPQSLGKATRPHRTKSSPYADPSQPRRTAIYMRVSMEVDFSSTEGMLQFHILAVFADWYLQNLSRETRKGKLGRVLKGDHNNQPPFGYRKTLDGKLEIVPAEGEALQEAFESYAAGRVTDRQIAELFNARGLQTRGGRLWSKDAVRDIMQNDFYYGVVEYRTDLHQGNHPPIISKELFDEATKVRRAHRRAPPFVSQCVRQ